MLEQVWWRGTGSQRQADPLGESIQSRSSDRRQSAERGAINAAQLAQEPLLRPETFTKIDQGVGSGAASQQGTLQEGYEIKAGWLSEDGLQPPQRPIT